MQAPSFSIYTNNGSACGNNFTNDTHQVRLSFDCACPHFLAKQLLEASVARLSCEDPYWPEDEEYWPDVDPHSAELTADGDVDQFACRRLESIKADLDVEAMKKKFGISDEDMETARGQLARQPALPRSHLPAFLRGRLCSDGLCPGLGVLPPGRTCEKGSGLSVGSQLHLPNAARVRMTLERVKKRVTISRGSFQEVRS